ncbi:MAG: hypothetical protein QXF61_11005 [Nitrososphaeria archaeon]
MRVILYYLEDQNSNILVERVPHARNKLIDFISAGPNILKVNNPRRWQLNIPRRYITPLNLAND